jgi:hypothetical protein
VRRIALGFGLLTSIGCGGTESATTGDADAQDAGMAADAVAPDGGADSGMAADAVAPDGGAMAGDARGGGADVDPDGEAGLTDLTDASSASCVSVTGGSVEPWLDLWIAGSRFDAHEGRRIRIVVSSHVGGRLGVADATVTNGAFEVTMPGTINYSYYTEIAFYVDNDTDDTCDVGEPTWGFVTGIVQENLVVDATPDGPCVSGGGPSVGTGCRPWPAPVGDCFVNGQADLQMYLPCPIP